MERRIRTSIGCSPYSFSSTILLAVVLTLSHQMWPGLSLPFHSEIQFYTRTPILWFSGCLDHLFKFACSGLQVFILHSKKYKNTDLLKSHMLTARLNNCIEHCWWSMLIFWMTWKLCLLQFFESFCKFDTRSTQSTRYNLNSGICNHRLKIRAVDYTK